MKVRLTKGRRQVIELEAVVKGDVALNSAGVGDGIMKGNELKIISENISTAKVGTVMRKKIIEQGNEATFLAHDANLSGDLKGIDKKKFVNTLKLYGNYQELQ